MGKSSTLKVGLLPSCYNARNEKKEVYLSWHINSNISRLQTCFAELHDYKEYRS